MIRLDLGRNTTRQVAGGWEDGRGRGQQAQEGKNVTEKMARREERVVTMREVQ